MAEARRNYYPHSSQQLSVAATTAVTRRGLGYHATLSLLEMLSSQRFEALGLCVLKLASWISFICHPRHLLTQALCDRKGEDASLSFTFGIIGPSGVLQRRDLEEAIGACFSLALAINLTGNHSDTILAQSQPQIRAATAGALSRGGMGAMESSECMDFDAYCRWSKTWPAVHNLLASLLKLVDDVGNVSAVRSTSPPQWELRQPPTIAPPPPLLPLGDLMAQLPGDGRDRADDLLLQPFSAWMLSACLPPGEK